MIITERRIAVPDVNAPRVSANAARAPIARPPIIVKGIIYLERIDSNTLGSFLNPGICKPEERIFFAWLDSSIPEVFTQNTAKTAERAMYARIWVNACKT